MKGYQTAIELEERLIELQKENHPTSLIKELGKIEAGVRGLREKMYGLRTELDKYIGEDDEEWYG